MRLVSLKASNFGTDYQYNSIFFNVPRLGNICKVNQPEESPLQIREPSLLFSLVKEQRKTMSFVDSSGILYELSYHLLPLDQQRDEIKILLNKLRQHLKSGELKTTQLYAMLSGLLRLHNHTLDETVLEYLHTLEIDGKTWCETKDAVAILLFLVQRGGDLSLIEKVLKNFPDLPKAKESGEFDPDVYAQLCKAISLAAPMCPEQLGGLAESLFKRYEQVLPSSSQQLYLKQLIPLVEAIKSAKDIVSSPVLTKVSKAFDSYLRKTISTHLSRVTAAEFTFLCHYVGQNPDLSSCQDKLLARFLHKEWLVLTVS